MTSSRLRLMEDITAEINFLLITRSRQLIHMPTQMLVEDMTLEYTYAANRRHIGSSLDGKRSSKSLDGLKLLGFGSQSQ